MLHVTYIVLLLTLVLRSPVTTHIAYTISTNINVVPFPFPAEIGSCQSCPRYRQTKEKKKKEPLKRIFAIVDIYIHETDTDCEHSLRTYYRCVLCYIR